METVKIRRRKVQPIEWEEVNMPLPIYFRLYEESEYVAKIWRKDGVLVCFSLHLNETEMDWKLSLDTVGTLDSYNLENLITEEEFESIRAQVMRFLYMDRPKP